MKQYHNLWVLSTVVGVKAWHKSKFPSSIFLLYFQNIPKSISEEIEGVNKRIISILK
jgi:ABC-type sugar transport system permease subunit